MYGGTAIVLSDLVGNRRLALAGSINGRIEEAQVFAAYQSLANRFQYTVGVQQSPTFFLLGSTLTPVSNTQAIQQQAIARYIAREQGWTAGEEVGWQVRFEHRYGPETRLLVATEGILTRRLQSDPLLSGFRTIVLDEFHERSLHADLALAFARQALRARDDLRLLVMSATLDPGPVARFLADCPVVEGDLRPYPVETRYEPGRRPSDALREVLARPGGHVLCFLPGAPEIRRVQAELVGQGGHRVAHVVLAGQAVASQARALDGVKEVISSRVGGPAHVVESHLF